METSNTENQSEVEYSVEARNRRARIFIPEDGGFVLYRFSMNRDTGNMVQIGHSYQHANRDALVAGADLWVNMGDLQKSNLKIAETPLWDQCIYSERNDTYAAYIHADSLQKETFLLYRFKNVSHLDGYCGITIGSDNIDALISGAVRWLRTGDIEVSNAAVIAGSGVAE